MCYVSNIGKAYNRREHHRWVAKKFSEEKNCPVDEDQHGKKETAGRELY